MDRIEIDGIQLVDNLTYGSEFYGMNMTELNYENISYPADIRLVILANRNCILNCEAFFLQMISFKELSDIVTSFGTSSLLFILTVRYFSNLAATIVVMYCSGFRGRKIFI